MAAARVELSNSKPGFGKPVDARRRERIFYTTMALAIVAIVFAGFSRTFFLRPYFHTQSLIPLLIVHGLVFSSWLALFVVQTTLIAAKRTRTHMRLGVAGGVLAVLMILVGTVTAILRAKGPSPIPGIDTLSFLTIPLGDILVFAILVGAAFHYRRKLDTHKRLMLLATIALLPAAVARLPIRFIEQGGPLIFFGLSDLMIVPCIIYDFISRGRPHRATLLGGTLIVVSHFLRIPIGMTHAWLVFARFITQWT